MKRNKKTICAVTAAAAAGLLLVNAGLGSALAAGKAANKGEMAYKDETVYVKLSPTGETEKVIVSDWLKNENGAQTIRDQTTLSDIENIKGEEEYRVSGDNILWDAGGNDIYYQGTTGRELPVSVKITYYLDGKEILPEELAGKSGRVRMVYEYTNLSRQGDIYTPFSMITGMVLSSEHFSNIEVKNGKVISDGENYIVVGIGLPGLSENLKLERVDLLEKLDLELPESFEVEADVEEFKLSMSMTAALPLNLSELDLEDSQDWEELQEKINELKDGATQLTDGTGELVDGIQTLKDSCVELIDGMEAVDENMGKLDEGIGTLNEKKGELTDGADALAEGLNTLNTKKDSLTDGIHQLADGIHSLNSSRPELVNGLKALVDGIEKMEADEIKGGLVNGSASLTKGLKTLDSSGIEPLEDGSRQLKEGLKTLAGDKEGSLKAGLSSMQKGLSDPQLVKLTEGLNTYIDSVGQLADALAGAAAGNEQAGTGFVSGSAAIVENLKKVSEGLTALDGQVQAMMQQIEGGAAAQSISGTSGVQDAAISERSLNAEAVEGEPQTVTKNVDVNVEVSFAESNGDAVAALQTAIQGNQSVLNSLYDVRAHLNSIPGELLKTYSGAYSVYAQQLDNCIAELEQDVAAGQSALAAMQAVQTIDTVQEVELEVESIPVSTEPLYAQSQTAAAGQGLPEGMTIVPKEALRQIAGAIGELQQKVYVLTQEAQKLTADTNIPATDAAGQMIKDENGKTVMLTNDQYLLYVLNQVKVSGETLKTGVQTLNGSLGQMKSGVEKMQETLYGDGTKQNAGALNQLCEGSSELYSGIRKLGKSVKKQILPGAQALEAGIAKLYEKGLDEMYGGLLKLNANIPALDSGIQALDKGSTELESGAGTLANGIGQLADGGNQLKAGATELSDGVSELAEGSGLLKEGTQKLADGGEALGEGVDELADGAVQLQEGMDKFQEEAIDKIINFAEEDLQDAIDRLNEIRDAGDAYRLFSDSSSTAQGKVKFIMETASIEP